MHRTSVQHSCKASFKLSAARWDYAQISVGARTEATFASRRGRRRISGTRYNSPFKSWRHHHRPEMTRSKFRGPPTCIITSPSERAQCLTARVMFTLDHTAKRFSGARRATMLHISTPNLINQDLPAPLQPND